MDSYKKYADENKKTRRRVEKRILNKAAKSNLASSIRNLSRIATIMEQNGIGLKQLCDKDFRYNYYNEQINVLRPLPSETINSQVASFLKFSYVLNSILMIQNPELQTIKDNTSQEFSIGSWQLSGDIEEAANKTLTSIKEHLDKYIRDKE